MSSMKLMAMPLRRSLLSIAVVAAATIAGPVASAAGLEVSRVEDRILDPDAHARITFENTVNIASYQQDGVLTYNGHQYTAWYQNAGSGAGAATSVIARRALPDGDWESAHLDHPLWSNDSHNTIALGVTESDGRLHVTFPTHDAPVRYTRSVPGLLDDPEGFEWSSLLFDSVHTLFPGAEGAPQTFTYPQFENVGDETLVTWRDGSTSNGRQAVLRYDDNAAGTWTFLGRFSHNAGGTYNGGFGNSTSRYGYIHGFTADPGSGDLAVTFSWREQNSAWCTGPLAVGNHDLGYAVSSDAGLSWANNDGEEVAETTLGSTADTITPFTDGIVVEEVGINKGLINQETQSFDSEGRLHVVTSRVPDEDISGNCVGDFYVERAANARPYHHWRDEDGSWQTMQLPFRSGSSGRTKIAFDSEDNAYVVLPDARIVAASAASGWTDWEPVFDDPEVENVSETIIDRQGVRGSDVLTVAYQEPPSNVPVCRTNTASTECASAYRLASFELGSEAPDAPRAATPEAAPVPFEGYADDVLNLALNRSGEGLPEAYAHQQGFPPSQESFPPRLVNDGSVDSFWVSGSNMAGDGPTPAVPVYLGVDLGEAHPLGEVQMVPRPNFGPLDYTVEVSSEDVPWSDAEGWTEVAAVTGAPNGPTATKFVTTEARHLRLRITGSRDTAGQPPRNTQVAELQVLARDDSDTTPPEVDADLAGTRNASDAYINAARLTLDAADDESGVYLTEYSADGGDWQGYERPVAFDQAGEHIVAYRATDYAGNTSAEEEITFAVVEVPGCAPRLSDEFAGTLLDATRWSFRHPTTPEDGAGSPSVSGGNLNLPLGAFSLDLTRPGPIAFLGQPLPEGDFAITAKISAPGLNADNGNMGSAYAQVGLKLFQTDDDWVKVSQTRNADGGSTANTYFELAYESGGSRTLGDRVGNAPAAANLPTFWLRLVRAGDQVSAAYALSDPEQGGSWAPMTFNSGTVSTVGFAGVFSPSDGPVYIGAYGGNGTIEATYDYIRFEPDELDCADATAPLTTAALAPASPGPGGTYGGPVEVTLSAGDGTGEEATGVDFTEYRVTADGNAGEWVRNDNPGAAEPLVTELALADEGEYLIEFRSADLVGNVEEIRSVSLTIDPDASVGTPRLRLRAQPKLRKVGPNAKRTRFILRARNVGDAPSGPVRLCAAGPKKRVKIAGKRCLARQIPVGAERSRRVVVRVKPAARGKVTRINLIARGPNVNNQKVTVRLRAR